VSELGKAEWLPDAIEQIRVVVVKTAQRVRAQSGWAANYADDVTLLLARIATLEALVRKLGGDPDAV
jgi:hypothetical protein